MEIPDRNYLLFETRRFVDAPSDHCVDRWLPGCDCAGWFYARLLTIEPLVHSREPLMEDWGWTFEVLVANVPVRVNLWCYSIEDCWLFHLATENSWFQRRPSEARLQAIATVRTAFEKICGSDPEIMRRAWFSENPFDLQIDTF
jgi:hypothetical protein